jgi:AcrR family transcriptional regulator
MNEHVKQPRRYRSERRREQALETRERVLEAAHRTFVEQGYGGATIASIAADAGVSAETVYATFGNKRTLLKDVLSLAARGGRETPILEQQEPRAALAADDPREKIRLFAADISGRLARAAPVMAVLAAAAQEEPELAELRETMHAARRANLRQLALALGATRQLATDVESATDTIWALASPELYTLLVGGPGRWTAERYEPWLAESLVMLLLGE